MSQKYPDPIDGYDFIIGRGGKPSYRLNRKLTAGENVPEHIKAQLLEKYEMLSAERAEENRQAAAAEAAKEAQELVNPTPPVAAVDLLDDVEIEEPPVQAAPLVAPLIPATPEAQAIANVMPTPQLQPPVAPGVETFGEMTPEEQAILDAYPTSPTQPVPAELPAAPMHAPLGADEHPSMRIAGLEAEVEKLKSMIAELLAGSVYEAELNVLAEQLAERFNVYTVFIGREPSHSDIHPITAEIMNNFDRGLAYKQYVRATLSGTLSNVKQAVAVAQSDPRFERPVPASVQPLPPQARTLEEHSHLNGQIKNAESYGIDGIIQDPPIFNRRPIVDESWLSKAKSIDDFDLEQL